MLSKTILSVISPQMTSVCGEMLLYKLALFSKSSLATIILMPTSLKYVSMIILSLFHPIYNIHNITIMRLSHMSTALLFQYVNIIFTKLSVKTKIKLLFKVFIYYIIVPHYL